MNLTPKKLIIITALLAGIAIMASCSKEPGAKTQNKGKKAPAASNALATTPDPRNIFTAARNGQFVTLNWHIYTDAKGIRQIHVMRSPTGKGNLRKVAEMDPGATSCQDCLPNEFAYWYWLRLVMDNGKYQEFGPAGVGRDKAGASGYIKPEEKYAVAITRTDDFATIKWNFPEAEYKSIRLYRNTRPVDNPFAGSSEQILTSLSWESQYTNALPDSNSEYWYWFQIVLKSGVVISKGPIKAEFDKR